MKMSLVLVLALQVQLLVALEHAARQRLSLVQGLQLHLHGLGLLLP